MAKPEKLNLWDRIFNRYRKEFYERGSENWCNHSDSTGIKIPGSSWSRNWIEYKIIDRVTGSEEIKREYLN